MDDPTGISDVVTVTTADVADLRMILGGDEVQRGPGVKGPDPDHWDLDRPTTAEILAGPVELDDDGEPPKGPDPDIWPT